MAFHQLIMKIFQRRIGIILGIVFLAIFADQASKYWATAVLKGQPSIKYLNDFFRWTYVENTGAFMSLGSEMEGTWHFLTLKVFPVIMLLGLFFYIVISKSMNWWQTIAFSLILGGGISNIYDRLLYGGVVDFMNMGFGSLRTGIFNIADVCIMIGLFMMLPEIIKGSGKEQKASLQTEKLQEQSEAG